MKKIINIVGMTCGHCSKRVENALSELAGIKSAKVDLEEKNAIVELDESVSDESIMNAVDDAGYDVVSIKRL